MQNYSYIYRNTKLISVIVSLSRIHQTFKQLKDYMLYASLASLTSMYISTKIPVEGEDDEL